MARHNTTAESAARSLNGAANGAIHTASDLVNSAKSALNAGYEHASESVNDAAAYATRRGRKIASTAQSYAADAVPTTTRFVRNNPLLAVGLAVGLGIVLGLSAKR